MSLHFISGRPGSGKSMWAVRMIIDELRLTKRNISTNLALKLPDLAEYLHEKYGETFDMSRRIRVLSAQEVTEFWNHPCKGLDCEARSEFVERGNKKRTVPDFSVRAAEGGTLFLLDEIHEFFNARKWQDTGEDALFYLSQHRKLGDDVVCITQAIGNVDKQFRSVAQDYTVLRNLSNERIGIFRSINKMMRQTYLNPPTGAAGDKPMSTALMSIDVEGLGRCYDTAAGVGVVGRDADTKKVSRGISPYWMVAVLVLVAVGVMKLPLLFAKGVTSVAMAPIALAKQVAPGATNSVPAQPAPAVSLGGDQYGRRELPSVQSPGHQFQSDQPSSRHVERSFSGAQSTNQIRVTGVSIRKGGATVYLSDGRSFTERDAEFQFLGPRFVIVDGVKYPVWLPTLAAREKASRSSLEQKSSGNSLATIVPESPSN